MTEPAPGPTTPQPGERRLSRPPSERYGDPEADAADAIRAEAARTSVPRGLGYAGVAAILGAVTIVFLGGVLALSAGLLVVATVAGWAVGVGLRWGGGPHIRHPVRVRAALLLATLGVGLGQVGLWWYARSEGGVLGPIDYLAETFGFLVPLQFLVAWIAAWATGRAR